MSESGKIVNERRGESYTIRYDGGLLAVGFTRLGWTSGAIFVALWFGTLLMIAPRPVLWGTAIAAGLFASHTIAFQALKKSMGAAWPQDKLRYSFAYAVSYAVPALLVFFGRLWVFVLGE